MCIAILNPKKQLKDKEIKNSWDNNNQGAGLLYHQDNKLHTFKTYDYKDFLSKYKEVRKNPKTGSIVLHFRIATSGYDKYVNLHPFMVNEDLGFVHNGVISGLGDKKHSDTYYFNEILKGLPTRFIDNGSIREFIIDYIGHSKLVFLDSSNNHTIIREDLGHWDNGNWYSNDSYKRENDYVWYGNTKVEKSNVGVKDKPLNDWEDKWLNTWGDDNYEDYKFVDYYEYENATDANISKIAKLLGLSKDSKYFLNELEDLAFTYQTYDLSKIIKELEEYDNKMYTGLGLDYLD